MEKFSNEKDYILFIILWFRLNIINLIVSTNEINFKRWNEILNGV